MYDWLLLILMLEPCEKDIDEETEEEEDEQ